MNAGIILIVVFTVLLLGLLIWIIIKSTRLRTVSGKEGMLGESGFAVEDFQQGRGQVKIHGEIWQAVCGDAITKGDRVEITGMESSLVLEVRKKLPDRA